MPLILGRMSYANNYRLPFDGTVTVGNYTSIAARCLFLCGKGASHPPALNRRAVSNHNFGEGDPDDRPITIGSDVWIGADVIILPGVTIGHGAIVGAGAVVSRNVPPYAVAVGNPARVVKRRFYGLMIGRLLDLAWWDWPEHKVNEARAFMGDVHEFLRHYGG